MSINSAEEINETALKLLNEGEFYKAQALFRENVKKHPGHMTLNNLGAFYLVEGMELSDGRIRGAEKLGLKYLKAASAAGQSMQNLTAVGDYYFKKQDFEEAARCFNEARKLGDTYAVCNNLGACLYLLGDLVGARTCFESALALCDNSEDKATILMSYAYALFPSDREKSLEFLSREKQSIFMNPADEFVLLYLCGELQSASANIRALVDEYAVTPQVVAMIFDCLFRLGRDGEARNILELKVEDLEDFDYDMTTEIGYIRRAFSSSEFRSELIKAFQYQPPVIAPCYYIGCERHDPQGDK